MDTRGRLRVDVPALLLALGVRAERRGRAWWARCPAPGHDDRDASWSIVDAPGDPRTGSHHCFGGCGLQGGPWELAAAVLGLELGEAGRWVRERLGAAFEPEPGELRVVVEASSAPAELRLPHGVVVPSEAGAPWFGPALEYLRARGVEGWQLARWGVGYATRGKLAHRVVFPVYTAGRLASWTARSYLRGAAKRYLTPRRSEGADPDGALFGEPHLDQRFKHVVVVEGALKVLALERAGVVNVVGVLGASAGLGPRTTARLARYPLVLAATDPDPAGDRAAERLAEALARYAEVRRVALPGSPDDVALEPGGLAVLAAAVARAGRRRRG